MIDLADYFVWLHFFPNFDQGLLDTATGKKTVVILGGALIALVVFNLGMLYGTRRAQVADDRKPL